MAARRGENREYSRVDGPPRGRATGPSRQRGQGRASRNGVARDVVPRGGVLMPRPPGGEPARGSPPSRTTGRRPCGPATPFGRRRSAGRADRLQTDQLNVPTGIAGCGTGMPPGTAPSQQGAADGSHAAGSHAGPQAGAQAGAGAPRSRPLPQPEPHGVPNSRNDGRRQLSPPKQLPQPGAATRLASTIDTHARRDMRQLHDSERVGKRAVPVPPWLTER